VSGKPNAVLNEIIRRAYKANPPVAEDITREEWARRYYKVLGCKTVSALRFRLARMIEAGEIDASIELVSADSVPPPAPVPPSIQELKGKLVAAERKARRAAAWEEIFVDTIQSCLQSFEPIKIPHIKPVKDAKQRLPEFAMPIVSDMHVGAFHTREETAGLTAFNKSILFDEIRRWKTNLADCLAVVRSAVDVRRCIMPWIGDFPTGEDIYPKQFAELDDLFMEQISLAAYILADMALHCGTLFEEIEIIACDGNHGRTQTTTFNADRMVYMMVQLLLRDQPHIRLHLSRSPFVAFSEPSVDRDEPWNYLVSHGQDIRAWNRIPYYGLDRARAEWIDLTGLVYDSVIVGHHHRYAETPGWIMNGTWVPGSKYSIGKMRAASQATQGLLFHNPKIGFTSRWPLYLSPKPKYDRVDVREFTVHTPVTETFDQLIQQTLPEALRVEK